VPSAETDARRDVPGDGPGTRYLVRGTLSPHSPDGRNLMSPRSWSRPLATPTDGASTAASPLSPAPAFSVYFTPGTSPSSRNRPSGPVVACRCNSLFQAG